MDSGANCVKWATAKEQNALDSLQKTQGLFLSLGGGFYFLMGIIMLSNRQVAFSSLHHSIPLLISGAIALGTGIGVQVRKDASKAYDTSTQNMLVAGWSSLIAPMIMEILIWGGKKMNRPVVYKERGPPMMAEPPYPY